MAMHIAHHLLSPSDSTLLLCKKHRKSKTLNTRPPSLPKRYNQEQLRDNRDPFSWTIAGIRVANKIDQLAEERKPTKDRPRLADFSDFGVHSFKPIATVLSVTHQLTSHIQERKRGGPIVHHVNTSWVDHVKKRMPRPPHNGRYLGIRPP